MKKVEEWNVLNYIYKIQQVGLFMADKSIFLNYPHLLDLSNTANILLVVVIYHSFNLLLFTIIHRSHTYFDSCFLFGMAKSGTSAILDGSLYAPGPGTTILVAPTIGRLLVPKPNEGAEVFSFSDELTYAPGPGTIAVVSG